MWLTKLEHLADPRYGLTVVFESGWKRRGASGGAQMKAVSGVLWHHDVSPRTGTYPLRAMLRDGRAGLSGPLCHIGFDRDGVVHVVGAGKANHAGTGSVPGVVRNGGNTRLIGIEMTSAGTKPWDWTAAQLRQMPKLGAALNDIFGLTSTQHWAHYEYSNGGKIDPAGLPGAMPGLRSRIASVRFGSTPAPGTSAPGPSANPVTPWTTSPRVAAMTTAEVRTIQDLVGVTVDGKYGNETGTAVRALQQQLDLTADGVWGPTTERHVMSLITDIWAAEITLDNGKRVSMANAIKETHAVGAENQKRIDRLEAIATENQRRITDTRSQTSGIRRDGDVVSLRQEIADTKTLQIAATGTLEKVVQLLEDANVDTTVPDTTTQS